MAAFGGFLREIFRPHADKASVHLFFSSACLFLIPGTHLLSFVLCPSFFLYFLLIFHLYSSLPLLSSPTHPSLNLTENLRRLNMLSFPAANLILSLHLSHLLPPLPLQTTSPLYLHFVLSSVCLILSSNCLPCLSNSSVCATPRHACHPHSFFLALCSFFSHAIAAHHSFTPP